MEVEGGAALATKLEKLFWSLLCGTALGLAGCEGEPGEDANGDAYGSPYDVPVGDGDSDDMPATDPLYGAPVDP